MSAEQQPSNSNSVTLETRGRRTLGLREIGIWAGETALAGGIVLAAQQLGMGDMYTHLAQSFHVLNQVHELSRLMTYLDGKPEHAQLAMMGFGFTVGAVADVGLSAATLAKLAGHVRLIGSGEYEVDDRGIRLQHNTCVDGRIPEEEQDVVEPGAGQMGGAFIRDQILAFLVHTGLPDSAVQDFFTGYLMGRNVVTAGVSLSIATVRSLWKGWVENGLLAQGPMVEFDHFHNDRCGWSGTESILLFLLKFTNKKSEVQTGLMDITNAPSVLLQQLVWNPMVNTVLTPLSGFSWLRLPGGPSTIEE